MRLTKAASSFDLMPCMDGYSGKLAFKGQLGLYDDSKRDSEATERRVISTAAGVPIPKRRVVAAAGTRFIIGHGNPDTYRGEVIRVGWVAHEAEELVTVCTLAQACLDQFTVKAYSANAWGKNAADNEQSSNLVGQFRLYFAEGEPVRPGMVVITKAGVYLTRMSHLGPAGIQVVLADLMQGIPIAQAILTSNTMDRRTESRSTAVANIQVLRARWQSLYEYRSNVAPKFGPMDLQVVVAQEAANPTPGDTLSMVDGEWQIDSVAEDDGVWLCRAVRHG